MMKTADGVEIVQGLRLWTNDLDVATVDVESRKPWEECGEWWFYVRTDRGRSLTSESRVATKHPFTGQLASERHTEDQS